MLTDDGEGGIDAEALEPFAARLLEATGAPEGTAAAVAESLVLADLRGHNSHGTRRIPQYTDSIRGDLDGVYSIDPSAAAESFERFVDAGATAPVAYVPSRWVGDDLIRETIAHL
jgi:uncharacterized oxidoreductase